MAVPRRDIDELEINESAIAADDTDDFVPPEIPGVRWLTKEEANALFDAEARQVMGMSGAEFLRRYDAGEFDDIPDDSEHLDFMSLVLSIPFGR